MCGELLIFDTNQQFATHRFGPHRFLYLAGLATTIIFDHGADHKMKEQTVRPRFPALYRPARVDTRVLGCPAQPALSLASNTERCRPSKRGPGSAHQLGFNGGNDQRTVESNAPASSFARDTEALRRGEKFGEMACSSQ